MDKKQRIIVYHAQTEERCEHFLSGKFECSTDTKWLGCGMYFWDNMANALYWQKELKRKEPKGRIAITQALIEFCPDELLDFTDTETLATFERIWIFLCCMDRTKKLKRMTSAMIGSKIDKFLELEKDDEFFGNVKLVKGFGEYRDKKSLNLTPDILWGTRLICDVKVIYSVRTADVIKERWE